MEHSEFQDPIAEIERILEEIQEHVAQEIESILKRSEGQDFPSLREKQEFASRIQRLLHFANKRVCCPRDACGKPSLIRVVKSIHSSTGVFLFEHVGYKESGHQSTSSVPQLSLCPKPPDLRERHNRK